MSDQGDVRVNPMSGAVRAVPPEAGIVPPEVARNGQVHQLWESRTRVSLTPLSPPSIIGLYGFMGATLMVGAWQAGWYGDAKTGFVLWPFAAIWVFGSDGGIGIRVRGL